MWTPLNFKNNFIINMLTKLGRVKNEAFKVTAEQNRHQEKPFIKVHNLKQRKSKFVSKYGNSLEVHQKKTTKKQCKHTKYGRSSIIYLNLDFPNLWMISELIMCTPNTASINLILNKYKLTVKIDKTIVVRILLYIAGWLMMQKRCLILYSIESISLYKTLHIKCTFKLKNVIDITTMKNKTVRFQIPVTAYVHESSAPKICNTRQILILFKLPFCVSTFMTLGSWLQTGLKKVFNTTQKRTVQNQLNLCARII